MGIHSPGSRQPFTQSYTSRKWTDIHIRWLNVVQVKYCSLLFTPHTGCPLISNPPLSPQTTQANGTIVWNSTSLSQGVWLTPTVHKNKYHIKGYQRGCLKVTGRRKVKGQSQPGRDGENKEGSWLAEWGSESFFKQLNPHSSTFAEIKAEFFQTK